MSRVGANRFLHVFNTFSACSNGHIQELCVLDGGATDAIKLHSTDAACGTFVCIISFGKVPTALGWGRCLFFILLSCDVWVYSC